LDSKPSPKRDGCALTREIMSLFEKDLSHDRISSRLGALRPDQKEKQASTSTVCACLYGETAKAGERKDRRGQMRGRVSIDERSNNGLALRPQ
jgi:hypothetical protein